MSSFSVGQELVDKLVNQDTIHRPSARQLVQAPYFGSVTRTKYLHIWSTEQCLASSELLTPPPLNPASVSSPRTKGGGYTLAVQWVVERSILTLDWPLTV
jgi:hypothetical protein